MLVVLLWILRILVLLLILRFVLRLIFGSGPPAARRPRRPANVPERVGGELVRDPQCGTYVPKARAIAVGSGAETKYFCSTTCRDKYGATT